MRMWLSRLSLPRVFNDTCLPNSCTLTTGVTFSMHYRVSVRLPIGRLWLSTFVGGEESEVQVLQFYRPDLQQRQRRTKYSNLNAKYFWHIVHKRHRANTFIIAGNREKRKPGNFPPDAKLSRFSYRPTSSDSPLKKGGFLIAHPGYFLMREWGQGIRVFFSVWHLVLYISELVFIYT